MNLGFCAFLKEERTFFLKAHVSCVWEESVAQFPSSALRSHHKLRAYTYGYTHTQIFTFKPDVKILEADLQNVIRVLKRTWEYS